MNKICKSCQSTFSTKNVKQIYCTKRCGGKAGQKRCRQRIAAGIPPQLKSDKWKKAVIASPQQVVKSTYLQVKRDSNPIFEFALTVEQFGKLIFEPCHYCGALPNIKTKSGKLLRNGLDRRDPAKGYIWANCVPSCWQCNRMKWQWLETEFLTHISKINQYQTSK